MIKKIAVIAAFLLAQNCFSLPLENNQQWTAVNNLNVKKIIFIQKDKPLIQRLFIKKNNVNANKDIIFAMSKLSNLPEFVAQQDLITGWVANDYFIINNSDIPKTYKVTEKICKIRKDKESCTQNKSTLLINPKSHKNIMHNYELSFEISSSDELIITSIITISSKEDSIIFETADTASIHSEAE